MITADNDALICDFAETYHIYDYRALPLSLVATLACGLGENSRIRRSMSGQTLTVEAMLLAMLVDRTGLILWTQTKDAQKGRNRPKSVLEQLLAGADSNKEDIEAYASGEEFEAERKRLTGGEG